MAEPKDLIAFDNEFYKTKEDLNEYGNELSSLIDRYISSVDSISRIAIKDQLITQALRNLIEQVKPAKKIVLEVAEAVGNDSINFIKKVDEADKFLY